MKFAGRVAAVWNNATHSSIRFVDGVAEVTTQQEIDLLKNQGFEMIADSDEKADKSVEEIKESKPIVANVEKKPRKPRKT